MTKDIPTGCVAVGNPCRVIREISERDREFYYRERRIPRISSKRRNKPLFYIRFAVEHCRHKLFAAVNEL